jgi:putative CocE/NonD family hydrolase
VLVTVEHDVEMRTPDGVALRSDIYRPTADAPLPVLLVRLPYNKATGPIFTFAPPQWYAERGYIVVVQDTRGRYASEGTFTPLVHEEQDSATAIEWAARLAGSNGRVGTYGGSYLGWVQLAAAVAQPPALAATAPAVISPDAHRWAWRNGAFNLHFALSWMLEVGADRLERAGRPDDRAALDHALGAFSVVAGHRPLRSLDLVRDELIGDFLRLWMDHPDPDDPLWEPIDFTDRLDQVAVPSLHVGGWYDMFVEGTIKAFTAAQAANGRQRLLIGPWFHFPWTRIVGEIDFGRNAVNPIDNLHVRWFDRWLKDDRNGIDEEPPVEVFVMGSNTWWRGDQFPPAGVADVNWYLASGGRANGSDGDGSLVPEAPTGQSPDHYYYDPGEPFPSIGGRSCCFPDAAPMGPYDQSGVHRYPTVLIYDSECLAQPLTVLGKARAEVFFDSTVGDTDIVVQLCDRQPDGRAVNVCEGIQRVRDANGDRVDIELGATGIQFAAGHRIRIAVTSSLFPAYDRNHNNGRRDIDGGPGGTVTAMQTVLHDAEHPSRLVLQTLPRP